MTKEPKTPPDNPPRQSTAPARANYLVKRNLTDGVYSPRGISNTA